MAFPSNLQFVPILTGGIPPTAAAGNVAPSSVDIVGNAEFPPAYYAYDGQNAYFRLRLQGDPRSNTSFQNFVWGLLIDYTDVPSAYEWMLAVTGGSSQINLIPNRVQGTDPLNDPPEGTDGRGYPNFFRPINNFDLARARVTDDGSTFGGSENYFFDFFLDTGTLFSQLVINASTPLRFLFFTSQTTQVFDKDSLPFSDIVTFNQANVRASLQARELLTDSPAAVLTGEAVVLKPRISVGNTGSSGASSVFVTMPFAADQISSITIESATGGNAIVDATTRTISWNIGNLASGAAVELAVSAAVIFTTSGERILNRYTVSGIDQFTGNTLPAVSGSQTLAVVAAASVSGTVQSMASGQPLPGVAVRLLPEGSTQTTGPQTTSGEAGEYGLAGLAAGGFTLEFELAGFVTKQIPISVQVGQSLIVNVLLDPVPTALAGTVTSAAGGEPVAGAQVRLDDPAGVLAAEMTSGPTGQFSFPSLPAGKLQLTIGAEGFELLQSILTLEPGSSRTLDVVLSPSLGGCFGTVSSSADQPIEGASVTILNEQVGTLFETTTDASGHYALSSLLPGIVFVIRATASGFASGMATVRVLPGQQSEIDFTLEPLPGSLSGEVREEGTGTPLPGIAVRIADLNGVTLDITETDAAGQFVFLSLPPGVYSLLVNSVGYANRALSVAIQSGADTFAGISLTRLSGAASGLVQDAEGRPIEGAILTVTLNGATIARDVTDSAGMFFLPSLYPESFIVTAEAAGFAAQTLGVTIEPLITASLVFTLVPLAGSVSGHVTDPSGQPLPSATVRVLLNLLASSTQLTQALTDEKGFYTIEGLPPGTYVLVVSLLHFQNAIGTAAILGGREAIESFRLSPSPGYIEGRVLDDQGLPIDNVSVSIEVTSSTGAVVSAVFAGIDGSYRSGELAPGFYGLFAFASGYRSDLATREVVADETTNANMVLVPLPGAVQGTVSDVRTGAPIVGATVKAVSQNGVALDVVISDNAGFYRLGGLRPGGYSIIAAAPTYEYSIIGAVVMADTVTQTDFPLSQLTGSIAGAVEPAIGSVLIQLLTLRNVLIDNTYTDAAGAFSFTTLRAESYVLTANATHYSSDPVGVRIAPGQTTEAIIRLRANPGMIAGRLADDQDQPISNGTVLVLDENETVRGTGHPDQFGRYSVGNLPAGTLSISVSAAGFSNAIGAVQLPPGGNLSGINFTLIANSGGISGLVTDETSGLPIAGAEVSVRLLGASGLTVAATTTSAFGDFLVLDLRPATYTVIFFAEGYAAGGIGAIVQSDVVTSASTALTRLTGSIAGTVTAPGGLPVSSNGISIKLFTVTSALVTSLFADTSGSFEITNLYPDAYVISVTVPGFITDNQTVYLTAGRTTVVSFALVPEKILITGNVVDAANQSPIAGALVSLLGRTGFGILTTYTDPNGDFGFRSTPVGRLTLSVSAVGFGSANAAINALPGESIGLRFVLDSLTGDVYGFVTSLDDGTALAGAEIRLFDRNQVLLTTVLTDNSGQYSFDQLSRGDYLVIASTPGFAASQGGFTIVPGQATKISFALQPLPARVFGLITDQSGGHPIRGAVVVLRPYNNFAAPLSLTSTDSSGFYSIRDLPAGNYVMNVAAAFFEAKQTSLYAGRGERVEANLALRAVPGFIEGTVTEDNTGSPVPDALVTVIDDNGVIIGQSVTDTAGHYLAGTGTEGSVRIVAVAEGLQFGEADSVLTLGQGARLDVGVAPQPVVVSGITRNAATGAPISGVVLSALTLQHVVIESIASDGEGRFSFKSLAPGTYIFSAVAQTYASTAQRATVTGSGALNLVFNLQVEFGTLTGTVRDAEGQPLEPALAEIFLTRMEERMAKISAARRRAPMPPMDDIFMRSMISNASGRYTVSNLPPGILRALFSFPGKRSALRDPVIIADQVTVLDVILEDEDEE
ncbi:carboxypeptidase regulatory-like domain-containing protein [Cohnella fermenti]|uniref:DUF11 domain-containing protein n=1 Tax=Cohnella fermenti TaxID=2565925 RepID=A0A4S4BQA0_9BACL|nr:carboxypeptidase regulatory-like domain-containing protein [Cohnella fermenti]THF77100.1 hypothetical protein E6C55_17195 [Cohnella fermenti]